VQQSDPLHGGAIRGEELTKSDDAHETPVGAMTTPPSPSTVRPLLVEHGA
jgi:hypothetical protein